jgi:DNA polymerase-3 subunit alpha
MTENNFQSLFQKIDVPFHGVRCPEITVDAETLKQLDLKPDCSHLDLLKSLCRERFRELLPTWEKEGGNKKDYSNRVIKEIDLLDKLGFVDYILIVWDVFNFCKKEGIPTGYGRGSSAGSLVLYLLGVTDIDPIKYDLYFERFVSEVRAKQKVVNGITYLDGSTIADIDSDICYYRRHEVLDYVNKKYPNKTCKMLTVGTLTGKALIKDCGKIVGEKTEDEMSMVTSYLPTKYGKVMDVEEAAMEIEEFGEWTSQNKMVFDVACKLKNLIRNKGVHASGILISYEDLDKSLPVELTKDKEIVSGYTMEWATQNNIKLDLLGLKSVSVVADVCKMIGLDYHKIDFEDYDSIYSHLQDLKCPKGIFQLEADVNYKVSQKVKPKNLDQLSAVVALARPGALAFAEQYAKYAQTGVFPETFPELDTILKNTGGAILYQESLMAIGNKVFGLSLDQAEQVRKCVSKKKAAEMPKWEKIIFDNAERLGIKKEAAQFYWNALSESANYSFCRGHSVPYGAMAALTIYLKFNHPKEFFTALLRMAKNEQDSLNEISIITMEMEAFGLKLLPPDLMKSDFDFSIQEKGIRYGLSAIKGISSKVITKLVKFRNQEHDNKIELFMAAKQAGISIGVLSALIQAGAVSQYSPKRSRLVLEAQTWNILTDKEKVKAKEIFDSNISKDILDIVLKMSGELKDDKNKPLIKKSRFETIKKKYDPYKQIYQLNTRNEELASYVYEKELLGFPYSESLAAIFQRKDKKIKTIKECNEGKEGGEFYFVGEVSESIKRVSKNQNPYLKVTLSDETGQAHAMMFDSQWRKKIEECMDLNNGELPKEKDIVVVKGKKKEDNTYFCDIIAIQSAKIFMKLRELKDVEE